MEVEETPASDDVIQENDLKNLRRCPPLLSTEPVCARDAGEG
jgi:hypothetical protein